MSKEHEAKEHEEKKAIDTIDTTFTRAFWKAITEDGVYTKLSSGVQVRLRQFPLHEFLLNGRLPNRLQQVALRVYNQGTPAIADQKEIDNLNFMDYVIAYAMVEPKATHGGEQKPDPEAISVHSIPIADRMEIFRKAMGMVSISTEKLTPFS